MRPYRIAKLVASIIFIHLKLVENSLGANFYKLLDQNSSSSFIQSSRFSQIFNDTIYEDGIAHLEINELNPDLSRIKVIEDTYKNILAMNETKNIFQRSFYWRTWREVEDIEGKSKLVCYRCQNVFNVTCTNCKCGYWEIEENPPCPFEIFSVINKTNICVAFYNQLKKSNSNCPSITSFREVGKCDNPLETRWRISRLHKSTLISERNVNVICRERENCGFSTKYSIFPDRVTFKIINSSNRVIYSKVMRNGNRNYAFLNIPDTQINSQHQKTPPFLKLKHSTGRGFSVAKTEEIIKDSTKENSNTINPSFIRKNKLNINTSTLRCKHLQPTPSEEEYEESEYNEY